MPSTLTEKDIDITTKAGAALATLGLDKTSVLHLENLDRTSLDVTVYFSGSLAEGLGNRGSDVDIFVIADREPDGPHIIRKSDFCISIHFAGRRRVDFEYWPASAPVRIAEKLDRLRLGDDFVAEKLTPVEELFVHRLFIGLPLSGASGFATLQGIFDRARFSGYLTQQAIHRIDGAHEDLCGMLEEQQWDVAVLRARDLMELSVDAWSFHRGRTNPLSKWRSRLLERCGDDAQANLVRRAFWELEFPFQTSTCPESGPTEAYVHRCMAFSEQVVQWIQG